jgi:hypothetical protein
VENRRKFIYLFLRIAAGMTLLFSLGLGFHLIYKSDNEKAQAVITGQSVSEKPATADLKIQKRSDNTESQSVNSSVNTLKTANNPHQLNNQVHSDKAVIDNNTIAGFNAANTVLNTATDEFSASDKGLRNSFRTDSKIAVLTGMAMLEPSPFPVPAPHRLGYRRLSQEEMQDQTAALIADHVENGNDDTEKENRWLLGSEIAPLYSYRKIESDYLDKSSIQDMNNSEQGLLALAGGLRVGYAAGRRLSVQSGLYYSRYGQEKNNGKSFSMDKITYLDSPNMTYLSIPNSTGTIQAGHDNIGHYENVITSSTGNKADFYNNSGFPALSLDNIQITEGDVTAIQYFDYLELPVTVKYKIIDRKLSFSLLGGLITNFLVNNSVQLKQNGKTESFGSTGDINKVNYQGSVGLGLDYPVMDRLAISLEPRFRYYLNPIDQRFDVHPYSFGIFAGFSYTLK